MRMTGNHCRETVCVLTLFCAHKKQLTHTLFPRCGEYLNLLVPNEFQFPRCWGYVKMTGKVLNIVMKQCVCWLYFCAHT